MTLGLRSILLIVAIVLFIASALGDSNSGDLLAFGLAAFAAAFLLGDGGLRVRR